MAACEKHELDNCADCTGRTAAHQDSLKDPTSWEQGQLRGALPFVQGGTTIWARFGGHCVGCGSRFEPGDPIFAEHGMTGDWLAECCFAERVPG